MLEWRSGGRSRFNLTGANLPSSALGSVTAARDWLAQMGVEMLNRGGFPQIQGPECDPGAAQSWSPAILAKSPHCPFPLILCASWSEMKLFAQLACGWQETGK